jgi:O-antigen/teichoic acid export membrane protein
LLKESLPVGFSAVSVALYFRLDNLFVFKLAGESALGLYAVCYRIVEPVLMVPASFSITAYTYLSDKKHQRAGTGEVTQVLSRTMWPAYAFVAVVGTTLVFTGKLILARFFSGYQAAYPILVVLVLALAVRTLNLSLTAVLNSRAKYTVLAKITATSVVLNVLSVTFLVSRWGALGAAWAALLTEILNTLMQGRSVMSSLLIVSCPLVAESVNVE